MIEVVEMFCARTFAPVEAFNIATLYPVAPGDAFQLRVGVRLLTVTPGGAALPGDNPVGTGGIGMLARDTLKLTEFEPPPPGPGLVTITGRLPAVARSDAVSEMVSWLLFTKEGM
jgi:hypothetical protein